MENKRVIFLFILTILGFFLLFYRAFQIQVLNWKDYRLEVQDLSTRIYINEAKRGNIYDRNGELIAWNEKLYQIYNNSDEIVQEDEEKIRKILSKTDLDVDYVIDRLNFQKNVILKISSTTSKKLSEIKNFIITEKYVRKYADNSLYHILGYVDNEGLARSGLEKVWNDKLIGKQGYKLVTITPSGKVKAVIEDTKSIAGNDIYTTLDIRLQKEVYNYFEKHNYKGSVIISDPENGDIVAMVSYPSPDPNAFSQGLSTLEFRKILNDSKKPLINRSIGASYFPGSLIKPFIAYSALEYGISPDATINSTGRYDVYNSKGTRIASFYDWNYAGHGITDMRKSLRVSANSYYYWLGETIEIDYMKGMANYFKLDKKTGIEIPGEKEGLFPNQEWKKETYDTIWYPGETILAYIGQGYVQLTPIELLRFYNILAENGKYFKFNLLKETKNIYGQIVEKDEPVLIDDYDLNKEFSNVIKNGMIDVTSYPGDSRTEGTAYKGFKDFDTTVAGKTGTAEVGGNQKSHGWFAGYLPAENPRYSMIVLVENGGYGPDIAVPFARHISDFITHELVQK